MSDHNDSDNQQDDDFMSLMGGEMKGLVRHNNDRADLKPKGAARQDRSAEYRRQAAQQQQNPLVDGLSDEIKQLVDSEQDLIYARDGVQLSLMKKLRKGHIPWQQGLDLHGYSIDQARDELSHFLRDAQRKELRCVIIVHGKALTEDGTPPIIKSYVNDWLRQLPQVLAFVSAQPQDGGTGALYVLLKRNRD
ncbi:Smr/MutS family protein [Motiliproteus sp.]|uniref:Smr/MutS family protein n=1 Tax=Motiliproteus sp. TaxID=1898955 RepID=UPI003BAA525A